MLIFSAAGWDSLLPIPVFWKPFFLSKQAVEAASLKVSGVTYGGSAASTLWDVCRKPLRTSHTFSAGRRSSGPAAPCTEQTLMQKENKNKELNLCDTVRKRRLDLGAFK